MKVHVADWQTLIHCVRITPRSGDPVYLTDHPESLAMGGHVYLSGSGYQMTDLAASDSMRTGSLDLEGILGVAGVTRDAIAAGHWDEAVWRVFATSWTAPVEDEEPLASGQLGKFQLRDGRYTAELLTLIDLLSQTVGETYSPTCIAVHGQLTGRVIKRCGVDLELWREAGSVTSITGSAQMITSNNLHPVDWWAYGLLMWTTGDNAGLTMQIKVDSGGGGLELFEAPPQPIQPGDLFTMTPGCRKRLQDCRDKFANVVNFKGFPNLPTNKTAHQYGV